MSIPMGEENFPKVEGGGSLILAWQIKNKRVLVVGGGEVAAGRILNVLNADAKVTVVSPREGLNPEVAYRVQEGQVDFVDRKFEPSDLDNVDMVLTAVDDPEASSQIWKLCKERKIAANIADVPLNVTSTLEVFTEMDLYKLWRQIASNLPDKIGDGIEKIGKLRQMLRKVAPAPEEGPKRMAWMIKVSDAYSLEDLHAMTEEDMEMLLRFYAPNQVPRFHCLQKMKDKTWDLGCLRPLKGEDETFDGSWGFSVGWG
ncbi:siroheme synthase [Botrytis cinerea]